MDEIQKTDGHYRNRSIEISTEPVNIRVKWASPSQISEGKDGVLLCQRLQDSAFNNDILYFSQYI